MTYAERTELKALSKDLYGKTSRWRKIMDRLALTPEGVKEYMQKQVAKRQELLEKMKKDANGSNL